VVDYLKCGRGGMVLGGVEVMAVDVQGERSSVGREVGAIGPCARQRVVHQ